jgi:IPT/TIG domain-containing protein
MRRLFIICLLALSATALVVSAPAASAAGKKASKPSITRVKPMRISVGARLTILGNNFKAKAKDNTVIFRAPNGRSAFAKPRRASRGKLVVVVPGAVSRLLGGSVSNPQPTRMKLRVLAGEFSAFTTRRLSPVVTGFGSGDGPAGGPTPGGGSPGSGSPGSGSPGGGSPGGGSPGGGGGPSPATCVSSADHDGDMLPNALEAELTTDPCLADTDGDGVGDGYEYKSAVDLNNDDYQEPNQSLPYPGKRPYPNPLDPSDVGTDFDGDTLALGAERSLWLISSAPADRVLDNPLSYSDGLQHSIYEFRPGQGNRRFPALPAAGYSKQADFVNWATAAGYRSNLHVPDPANPGGTVVRSLFDINLDGTESPSEALHYDTYGNGFLSDDERDEDADGLSNFDENGGRARAGWWGSCYPAESRYYITYADTDIADPDSDGDGVRDGADDQDHDDFPNLMELSRIAASGHDDRERGQTCVLAELIATRFEDEDPPHYNHPDAYGRVNPFNPCLPLSSSRTCNRFPRFDQEWAPFDQSPDWLALN